MQSEKEIIAATDAPDPNSTTVRTKSSSPRTKVFSRYPLPSDRTPFSTHFDILARFVTHSRNGNEPVAAEKVEGEGVPIQAAQMNVKFMTDIGLLKFDSKGLYLPSPEAIRFVNAKTVGDDRARPIIRALIQSAWFTEIASSVLRMRPVVTDDALIGELALAAETNKEKKGPALRVLVEYLVWSGILVRDERGLSLAENRLSTEATSDPKAGAPAAVASAPKAQGERLPGATPPSVAEAGAWHIVQTEDFFLKVRSDSEVIAEVGEQLVLLAKKIERLRTKAAAPASAPATIPSS
jgi:hypothetical protein